MPECWGAQKEINYHIFSKLSFFIVQIHSWPPKLIYLLLLKNLLKWYMHRKKAKVSVSQSCLTLCDPMDCSRPGSSVRGIFQARILEWLAISFSGGSSQPRDWTRISLVCCIAGRIFTVWATREAQYKQIMLKRLKRNKQQ